MPGVRVPTSFHVKQHGGTAGAMLAPPTELLMTESTADAPPQPVTTLYVGNLPPTVDEQILFQTFRPFGHIPDIQVAGRLISKPSWPDCYLPIPTPLQDLATIRVLRAIHPV